MRRREAATTHSVRIARAAWLAALLASLALLVALPALPAGGAETPEPDPFALDEDFELEEEEDAEVICFEAEEAFEEGEIDEAEMEAICAASEAESEAETAADGASECPLRSARAHAATRNGRLRLTIGYTTTEPLKATIQISKGSVRVRTFKRHLGKSGVLRFAKKLDKRRRGRIVVRIGLPSAQRAGCPSRRLVLFPR